jgi:hypothetical protein
MKSSRRREDRIGLPRKPSRRQKPAQASASVQAEPVQAGGSVQAELVKEFAAVADVVQPAGNRWDNRKWNKFEMAQLVLQKIYRGRDMPEKPEQGWEKLTAEVNERLIEDYPDYAKTTDAKLRLLKGEPLISRKVVTRAYKVVRDERIGAKKLGRRR